MISSNYPNRFWCPKDLFTPGYFLFYCVLLCGVVLCHILFCYVVFNFVVLHCGVVLFVALYTSKNAV